MARGVQRPGGCGEDFGGAVVGEAATTGEGAAVLRGRGGRSAALGRVSAYTSLGSYVLGPFGLVAAGPPASVVGAGALLGLGGVVWLLVGTTPVAVLPAVRGADPGVS